MENLHDFISHKHVTYSTIDILPYMHSCEGFAAYKIIESGELKATDCPVFKGKKLLYFFYGKPSYPVGEKISGNRTDINYCPICFLVKPEKVNLFRAFPFDTGAYDAKLYAGFLHRGMKLEDFELGNSLDFIQKYIAICFTNNNNYILGEPTLNSSVNNPIVDAFISLINANGTHSIDERSRSIEIITETNVPIKDSIEHIILPEGLLKNQAVKDFIDTNRIDYSTYVFHNLTAPARYNEVVFQKALEYIRKRGGYSI